MMKSAIDMSDAIIYSENEINAEVDEYAQKSGKKILANIDADDYKKAYNDFYDELLES